MHDRHLPALGPRFASHLLAYVNRGIQNADATNQFFWYASVLFTF